ncbi:agamous-like MADS-box protein AGL62 [Ricinus communis]|uniref:agamous-like MADS-box protein AGL62 n=1 Tax=Ricinus communis TaxID=3988 RepID=UPI00201AB837|nr:agamous-like MADS-box protein AGL62 [Ricinus communis]
MNADADDNPSMWAVHASKRRGGGGNGRRKIEIKKIQDNKTGLIVTFSKRRTGLFKKAMEFCNLDGGGAEVVLITFSPSGRPFSFGKPSPDSVVLRYLTTPQRAKDTTPPKPQKEEEGEGFLWEKGIKNLDAEEVEEYKDALAELKKKLVFRIAEIRVRSANTRNFF